MKKITLVSLIFILLLSCNSTEESSSSSADAVAETAMAENMYADGTWMMEDSEYMFNLTDKTAMMNGTSYMIKNISIIEMGMSMTLELSMMDEEGSEVITEISITKLSDSEITITNGDMMGTYTKK